MRPGSARVAPPRSFRPVGAVASVVAAQVADAAIARAEAEGNTEKAARLRAIYDEHLEAQHREAA